MNLLALDTSTLCASVAVLVDGDVAAAADRSVRTHSDVLLALIDDTLRAASISVDTIDGVAVGAGPGSFTGLRIGMATAKGLCFARGGPLWTVSSLAALAVDAGGAPGRTVLAALDARKGEVFAGLFRIDSMGLPEPLGDERVLPPDEVATMVSDDTRPLLVGTGVSAYEATLAPLGEHAEARATPSARSVALIALAGSHHANLAAAVPTYVRLSDAELTWLDHIP